MLFVSLWPGITAHNFIEGISQCSRKVQFAAAVFSFSVSGLLLLLQATSCQITISSRLHQLIFTAHPLLPVKRKITQKKCQSGEEMPNVSETYRGADRILFLSGTEGGSIYVPRDLNLSSKEYLLKSP